jgi:phage shock protein A
MSIMTRFVRLWKADIHGVMDQMEDKRLLLNQHLRDMETALERKDADLKALIRSRGNARAELEKIAKEAVKLNDDLNAAIQKDRDDIARFLIKKLRPVSRRQEELEAHIQGLDRDITRVQECLETQKMTCDSIRMKADAYFRKSEQNSWQNDFPDIFPEAWRDEASEEEIELELLRRKDAVKGGQ